jgi:antitoxin component YwqK of YwqJK toxin-antitoxin module
MAMVFMARRVRFLNNLLLLLLLAGCRQTEKNIPQVYVAMGDHALQQNNGFLLYKQARFCGWVYSCYENGDTAYLQPYLEGKEEGWSFRWYGDGNKMEERLYVAGRKEGIHRGWWPNGTPKFYYEFESDEHEGAAREWFKNGKPFRVFHYHRGQEEGQQQMWWEDGSLKANYVVKNGEQFGLIGRKLCKNVNDEKN